MRGLITHEESQEVMKAFNRITTPKIWLLVDAPNKLQFIGTPEFQEKEYKEALSKCERIEVVNPELILTWVTTTDTSWFYKGIMLKDGDTFEIDDEKVSVEIGYKPQCDKSCCDACLVYGCDEQHFKIATLKLKETVKEEPESIYDKILSQWEKDYGSVNTPQTMDAYAVSGFIQQVLKS